MNLLRKRLAWIVLLVLLQSLTVSATSLALTAADGSGGKEVAAATAGTSTQHAAEHSRGGKIAKWMAKKGLSPDVVVVTIAAMPIVELRGAIPVAHHVFHMGLVRSFLLSVVGNMIPVPFILLFLGPVSDVMRKVPLFDKFFEWLFARTRKRSATIQKYQEIGLILFIAVPLPVTGAWTGSLAAFLFGLRFWLSMVCVVAGVAIAGVVVSTFSAFGWAGAAAAGIILSGITAAAVFGRRNKSDAQDEVAASSDEAA